MTTQCGCGFLLDDRGLCSNCEAMKRMHERRDKQAEKDAILNVARCLVKRDLDGPVWFEEWNRLKAAVYALENSYDNVR